ncbi:hypothetical protein KI659_06955 [Litoribacter alkaliphilus]|uniref:Uncharacterized protein n=1 Tax=Litoribacter ruber TaxID=702568 RepID=A0AAP2CFP9_9BACT|nr:hypothetical protein [Litoribacter alkaliphilus]MBS9523756.1 hypothetical protein [Litoribacter alkaliphilus]
MKRFLSLLLLLLFSGASFGQTQLTEQTNVAIRNNEPNFQLLTTKSKVIGFRMISEQQLMSQQRTVQVLVADKNLELESTVTFDLHPLENLKAVDLDGDNLYFLSFYLQKDYLIRERHIYQFNIRTQQLAKHEVKGLSPVYYPNFRLDKSPAGGRINQVGEMGFNAFQVMDGKVLMAGMADNILLLQVFDLETQKVAKEKFVQADLQLQYFQKNASSKTLFVGVQHNDPKGINMLTHFEFDTDGQLIQDFSVTPWQDKATVTRNMQFIGNPYEKHFLGLYGPRRNEVFEGLYLYRKESVGGEELFDYNFTSLTSFHDHLAPDAKTIKTRQVQRNQKRSRPTPVRNNILINSFEHQDAGYLVYLNQYRHNNNPVINYNINQYLRFYSNSQVDNFDRYSPILPPNLQTPHTPSFSRVPREFTYLSGQFVHLDEDANLLWHVSVPFPQTNQYRSLPLASYHWNAHSLSYLMLGEDKLFASRFTEGTPAYVNKAVELSEISEESGNISKRTLALQHLEDHSYILSGQTRISENGQTKYVFFMKKIEVN